MRNVWRLYLLGLFLVGSPALSVAQQTSGEIEKAITALENQWLTITENEQSRHNCPATGRQVCEY